MVKLLLLKRLANCDQPQYIPEGTLAFTKERLRMVFSEIWDEPATVDRIVQEKIDDQSTR